MTELLHHHPGAYPAAEEQTGTGVPEIMEPLVPQLMVSQHLLEAAVHSAGRERLAERGGEHEPALLPVRAGHQTLLHLPLAMSFEGADGDGRQDDGPAAGAGLGLDQGGHPGESPAGRAGR